MQCPNYEFFDRDFLIYLVGKEDYSKSLVGHGRLRYFHQANTYRKDADRCSSGLQQAGGHLIAILNAHSHLARAHLSKGESCSLHTRKSGRKESFSQY